MEKIPPQHPLRRMFRVCLERVFSRELGLASPLLQEYLSDLLCDFSHVDRVYRIRDWSGRPLHEVASMLEQLRWSHLDPDGSRTRAIHRHIGDFTLFWSGVYPEALRRLRRDRTNRDRLLDYVKVGRRSYRVASSLTWSEDPDLSGIFKQLGNQFEVWASGLHMVRREWERLAREHPFPRGMVLGASDHLPFG